MKYVVFILFFPLLCNAHRSVGFGLGYSNALHDNSYSFGMKLTSQNIIKNIGFNLELNAPGISNHKGLHKDYSVSVNNSGYTTVSANYAINYSILAGLNYTLKRVLFSANIGFSKTAPAVIDYYVQSNYYSHFPSGPADYNLHKEVYPVKQTIVCLEGLIGYNVVKTPKFVLNTALGYNNNYGVIFHLSFLFSKSKNKPS